MLYPTQHHFPSFSFIPPPVTSSSSSTNITLSLLLPLSPPRCLIQGMEGALKSSLRPEIAVKGSLQQQQHQHPILDDTHAQNAVVSIDDFFVDDLLDLSKGGIEDGFAGDEADEEPKQDKRASSASASDSISPPKQEQSDPPTITNFSVKPDFGSVPGGELNVPADDLADLEWLSHFVEDSFTEYSIPFPSAGSGTSQLTQKPPLNRSEPGIPVSTNPCFSTTVHTKARSKRAKTGGRVWSFGSHLSETSSSSSSTSSSPSNTLLLYSGSGQTAEYFFGKSPAKKHRKRAPIESSSSGGGGGSQPPRRCSHCLVQKTPQWRAGPLGAKTLCNACGVRFKSGRLLPEYRPACSPTFSSEMHSNNHRKVLEMRRKKEGSSDSAPPAVQSF